MRASASFEIRLSSTAASATGRSRFEYWSVS
jgi:hypothetical protein